MRARFSKVSQGLALALALAYFPPTRTHLLFYSLTLSPSGLHNIFVGCFSGVISLFFLGWLIYGCVLFWGGDSDVSGGFEKNTACYYLHSLGFVWCILSLICELHNVMREDLV